MLNNNENVNENNEKRNEDIGNAEEIKITVSSLKEEHQHIKQDINSKNSGDSNSKNDNKMNDSENNIRLGFLKSFYYSTIRLDKIYLILKDTKSWFKYIIILLVFLSLSMALSISYNFNEKIINFKNVISEMPDFTFKDNEIKGDINLSFKEEDINRLIIINTTTESLIDIREEYKEKIDDVEYYILLTKDTIYAEPGESFEYSVFNFLNSKTIEKKEVIEFLEVFSSFKFLSFISGFIASIIILSLLVIISFFIGRFLIAVFTIFSIKTLSLKLIDKLAIHLMSMPLLTYVLFFTLEQIKKIVLPFNIIYIHLSIYLTYIALTIYILKDRYNKTEISKKIQEIKTNNDNRKDNNENKDSVEELEKKEKIKREKKRKIREKNTNTNKENAKNKKERKSDNKKDSITEGI